ncbi:MAG TPA: ribonuclease HIII [Candidatus Izemoplasmatales bacterium]|nr:ribonuclease HIII [Candidatus Izemoplasmatales bacterium]
MKTVLELNDKFLSKLVNYYKPYQEKPNTPHIKYLFKTDEFTINVYHSNKVLFQGEFAEEEYVKWTKVLDIKPDLPKAINQTAYMNEYYKKNVIGSDEVGTGDYFGPVVVTAALVGPKDYPFLSTYHIQDSKNIKDEMILKIAPHLMKTIKHHTLVLNNKKYNQLVNEGYNMNKIKAYLHNHAIKKLRAKNVEYDTIIVDQFCSRQNYDKYLIDQESIKQITLIEKAESIHQSVAVAAIIARYTFLKEMDRLSEEINITLPKGASASVDAIGKLIYLKHGKDIFDDIAKVNFKTSKKIWD